MRALLGIDLGTSSVKAVVCSLEGQIAGIGTAEYPILTPRPGYAEQDPEDWWLATVKAARQGLREAAGAQVAGVGLSGQMHGFVAIGSSGKPLRPAIIWADQRSASLLPEIIQLMGTETLATTCGNAPPARFLIAPLCCLQTPAPETLKNTAALLMPKDYIRFALTGELGTDASDAAASGIFDVGRRLWADEVIERLRFPRPIFPKVHSSTDIVGTLSKTAAEDLGLTAGIPVSAG